MRVLFAGTPDFAIPAFHALLNSEHEVVHVYTAAPKPKNRGKKMLKTPIYEIAEQYNMPVHCPISLKSEKEREFLLKIDIDIIVVVAYGLIIPEYMLNYPQYGCINLHPSLLPKWRGAAPIQRAIMNGDTETGIAIMQLDQGLDSGDILLQTKIPIKPTDHYQDIHDICASIGGKMIVETLEKITKNEIMPIKQDHSLAIYAHKIEKVDGEINWQNTAVEIINIIRGYPNGAYFSYHDMLIKCFAATYDNKIIGTPGTITQTDDKLSISCVDGTIYPLVMQRPGKQKLQVVEFLKGFSF